jgi:hypothetical protein
MATISKMKTKGSFGVFFDIEAKQTAEKSNMCRGPENDVHTRAFGLRLILFSKDIGAF